MFRRNHLNNMNMLSVFSISHNNNNNNQQRRQGGCECVEKSNEFSTKKEERLKTRTTRSKVSPKWSSQKRLLRLICLKDMVT